MKNSTTICAVDYIKSIIISVNFGSGFLALAASMDSVASVEIEIQDETVFAGDFGLVGGLEVLIEQASPSLALLSGMHFRIPLNSGPDDKGPAW